MVDIIIRFPTQSHADAFCAQMSDGFGEGFCDFSSWQRAPGTDGTKKEHFNKVLKNGIPVFFVNEIFEGVMPDVEH